MIPRKSIVLLLACSAATAGCRQMRTTWPLKVFFPPSGQDLYVLATDPNDPDKRREGISKLSEQGWAQNDTYRRYFQVALLKDPDPSVRSAAARALGEAGDPNYLPALVQTLDDPAQPVAVRWDCAVALDKVIGPAAVEPLREHTRPDVEGSEDVRAACARALRHYPRQEVVQTLVAALGDPSFGVQYAARRSLVVLTGKDLGSEPEDWAPVIGQDVAPPAEPEPKRPWWDWLGRTDGDRPGHR